MHRDLKPGNVMLTKSGAKLLDFGLAPASGLGAASESTSSPTVAVPEDRGLVGVTRDLRRFLVIEGEHLSNPSPLRVITAWPERMAR